MCRCEHVEKNNNDIIMRKGASRQVATIQGKSRESHSISNYVSCNDRKYKTDEWEIT